MPTDTWKKTSDTELADAKRQYQGQIVRWNIVGETVSRQGRVNNVLKNSKNEIILFVHVALEGEEPYISKVKAHDAQVLKPSARPGLFIVPDSTPK